MATPLTEYTPITEEQAKDIGRVARGLSPFEDRARYELNWKQVSFEEFEKSKTELMSYKQDIRKILTDNTVKGIQEEIDGEILDGMRRDARRTWGGLYPMTPFDNLTAGFPMRGCPIDTRGLR